MHNVFYIFLQKGDMKLVTFAVLDRSPNFELTTNAVFEIVRDVSIGNANQDFIDVIMYCADMYDVGRMNLALYIRDHGRDIKLSDCCFDLALRGLVR
jgi:hypothetical protein